MYPPEPEMRQKARRAYRGIGLIALLFLAVAIIDVLAIALAQPPDENSRLVLGLIALLAGLGLLVCLMGVLDVRVQMFGAKCWRRLQQLRSARGADAI